MIGKIILGAGAGLAAGYVLGHVLGKKKQQDQGGNAAMDAVIQLGSVDEEVRKRLGSLDVYDTFSFRDLPRAYHLAAERMLAAFGGLSRQQVHCYMYICGHEGDTSAACLHAAVQDNPRYRLSTKDKVQV